MDSTAVGFLETETFRFLGGVDTIGSVLTLLFSLATLLIVAYREYRWRKAAKLAIAEGDFDEKINQLAGITSSKPVALCLSFTSQTFSIKKEVNKYLIAEEMKMPIVELNRNGIRTDELGSINQELRRIRHKIAFDGYTEVHLFLSGPVAVGLLVGALLDNWKLVKVYHYNQGTYEYWYPLIKN
ncbi:hypothetical protein SAMN06298216_3552 [Spirosomataceae bacterium TFI 002]|nr:hypothetical protein SAMN06298216_3552 [Spirosomataceae bacterium TFI 002]